MKKKYIFGCLALFLGVLAIFLSYFLLKKLHDENKSSDGIHYRCQDNNDSTDIRCVTGEPNESNCYGYYKLKSANPRDGLLLSDTVHATCEGILTPDSLFFAEDGSFVSKN